MRSPRLSPAALLCLSTAAVAQQPTTAASDYNSNDIIVGASIDPASCNAGNATAVPFEDAISGRAVLTEKCIKVEGFWSGRALFWNAGDANSKFSNASHDLARRRIGIYGSEHLLAAAPKKASRFTVVGKLRHCATAWPGAMMVMGYCHYTDGPFLIASEAIDLHGNVR